MSLSVTIIGFSITGSIAAVLFKRLGYNVTIVERSKTGLQARGAGLAMPLALVKKLKELGLVDEDIQLFNATNRRFFALAPTIVGAKEIWSQSITATAHHWDTLYSNLQTRTKGLQPKYEHEVVAIEKTDTNKPVVKFADGSSLQSDLILCADGYDSFGRQTLHPKVKKQYADYIAWRGVLPCSELPKGALPLAQEISYYCCDKGHYLFYPIYHNGEKILNWIFYEKFSPEELNAFSTDFLKKGSIAPGHLPTVAIGHLQADAKKLLPPAIAAVITKTKQPFAQVIYDVMAPSFVKNRVALAGDATGTIRPHAGAGVSTAIEDVLALYELLQKVELDQALTSWNQKQMIHRKNLRNLAEAMGEALVLNPENWPAMDHEKMNQWWTELVAKHMQWYLTAKSDGRDNAAVAIAKQALAESRFVTQTDITKALTHTIFAEDFQNDRKESKSSFIHDKDKREHRVTELTQQTKRWVTAKDQVIQSLPQFFSAKTKGKEKERSGLSSTTETKKSFNS